MLRGQFPEGLDRITLANLALELHSSFHKDLIGNPEEPAPGGLELISSRMVQEILMNLARSLIIHFLRI